MADSVDAYVRAALKLHGYDFDVTRIAAVSAQFARIEAAAKTVLTLPMDERGGAAAVFRP